MDHKYFSLNTLGRDFVIGDLHGCYGLLAEKLTEIRFNPSIDRIFSVGDLIDRGEQNLECIDLLNRHWFHTVKGNHEDMMCTAILESRGLDHWYVNGGNWSETVTPNTLYSVALKMDELPYAITVDTLKGMVGICHAQPPSNRWNVMHEGLNGQNKQTMLWARNQISRKKMNIPDMQDIFATIHGHTPLHIPQWRGNALYIDTGAVFTGNLTCIQINGAD